jgi:hypothetical protein
MPRMLLFCPCENVLVGQGENASLIVILHQVQMILPAEVPDPIPPNAAAPFKWQIFAQYECDPTDAGVKFEQQIKMVKGNTTTLESTADFVPEANKPIHRMIASLTFFPLVPAGLYRLVLSLRRAGEQEWGKVGDYPFEVTYQR